MSSLGIIGAGAVARAVVAAVTSTGMVEGLAVVSATRAATEGLVLEAQDMAAATHTPLRVEAALTVELETWTMITERDQFEFEL